MKHNAQPFDKDRPTPQLLSFFVLLNGMTCFILVNMAAFFSAVWLVMGAIFIMVASYMLLHRELTRQWRSIGHDADREDMLCQMTETMDDIFWIYDLTEKKPLYISPVYEKMWGDSLVYLHQHFFLFMRRVVKEDRPEVALFIRRLPREASEIIFRIIRKQGNMAWVKVRLYPIFRGGKRRIVGSCEEVTSRMVAEMALRKSEQMLKGLFFQSPDWIRIVNGRGEEILSNRLDPFFSQQTRQNEQARIELQQKIKNVLTYKEPANFQQHLPDGQWLEIRLVPLANNTAEVGMVMVIATDISEIKTLEEQAGQNARLAALGLLAAGVAHEMNNPNNAIYYHASLLHAAWDDMLPILDQFDKEYGDFAIAGLPYQEMREHFPLMTQGIIDNTQRIKKLVDDLKRLSKEDEHHEWQKIFLPDLLHNTLGMLAHIMQKYTDHCIINIAPDLPTIYGHSQRLEQVFLNLLLNSLQALQNRQQAICLDVMGHAANEMVVVLVRDEGCGIPQGMLSKIMEPFVTTKQKKGGTGLGLYIASSIIRDHGGTLEFASEEGKGTTVRVCLPTNYDKK